MKLQFLYNLCVVYLQFLKNAVCWNSLGETKWYSSSINNRNEVVPLHVPVDFVCLQKANNVLILRLTCAALRNVPEYLLKINSALVRRAWWFLWGEYCWAWRSESSCQPSSTKPLSGEMTFLAVSLRVIARIWTSGLRAPDSSSQSLREFMLSWHSQERHGRLDKASAFECFFPVLWVISRLYVSIYCNHLAVWPVEFFRLFIQLMAALSVRKKTFWP